MKRLMSTIIMLFGFALVFPLKAIGDIPTHNCDSGNHHGNFKVADLYLDGESEIVLLEGDELIVMDNQGEILFTKTVEGINGHPGDDDDHHHHMVNSEGNTIATKHNRWRDWQGHDHHNGGVSLEVANLDDDQDPEIIIKDAEKLIVLDNEGNQKYTITLP